MAHGNYNILFVFGDYEIYQVGQMIELYSGTPGSGKSLNACNIAREYYKKGRPVITNYDINFLENQEEEGLPSASI